MRKPLPTDEPPTADPTQSEPAAANSTTFEPIADTGSAGSKKARAKKAAIKEPMSISYMLLIRVTFGDKNIVEESSMECLRELESTFDYGKELQKQ